MKSIPHHCKFCGTAITLQIEESALEMFNLEWWKGLAACNRCADFREQRRNVTERLLFDSVKLERHQTKQVILSAERLSELKENIHRCARQFSELCHRYYRKPFVWEPGLANELIDQPDKIMTNLRFYERCISRPVSDQPPSRGTHPDP